MNVARGLLRGGSRSAKHCVFPCEVAAAGDEGQLVCVAGAGWDRSDVFFAAVKWWLQTALDAFACA